MTRPSLRSKLLLVGVLLGIVAAGLVGYQAKVSAVSCSSGFFPGYFNGGCAYSGNFVSTHLTGTRNVGAFVTTIRTDVGNCSGTAQNHIGAMYIVLTMMGYPSGTNKQTICNNNKQLLDDWESNIRQLDASGQIDWWYCPGHPSYTVSQSGCNYSYSLNTFYNSGDVYQYSGTNTGSGAVPAIAFLKSNGTPFYIIKHECGNPVGNLGKIPKQQVDIKGTVYFYNGSTSLKLKNVKVTASIAGPNVTKSTGPGGVFDIPLDISTDFRLSIPATVTIGSTTYSKPVVTPNRSSPSAGHGYSGASNCSLDSIDYKNQRAEFGNSTTAGCGYGLTDNTSYNFAYTQASTPPPNSFTYDPTAVINISSGTAENPTGVQYYGQTGYNGPPSSLCAGGADGVNGVSAKYTLTYTPYGGAPQPPTITNFPPSCVGSTDLPTKSGAPPIMSAGDQLCLTVTIDPGSGSVNGSNNIILPKNASITSPQACIVVKNEPYFTVNHGSVYAGGEFASIDPACNEDGNLGGWFNNSGAFYGSGTQLAAISNGNGTANGIIRGFVSGLGTFGASLPSPNGSYLSFANDNSSNITTDNNDPLVGGAYGGISNTTHCISSPPLPATWTAVGGIKNVNLNSFVSGAAYKGNVQLDSSSGLTGTNILYVKGDVYIHSDIKYTSASWAIGGAPLFELVVVGGNIYIDPSVSQLDGLYYAENDSPTGTNGRIFTCGYKQGGGFVPYDHTQLFSQCNQSQLVVNGAFIADKVNLMRTYGSLRDGPHGKTGKPGSKCSNQGATFTAPNVNSCAAEFFQYSPEMFLAPPGSTGVSGGKIKFDAVTTLPPIL